jgi:hypothetical protein
VDKRQERRIEEIMERIDCPHDFRCYGKGVERDRGVGARNADGFIECLEERPWECESSMPFKNAYLCQCGVRLKIAEILAG